MANLSLRPNSWSWLVLTSELDDAASLLLVRASPNQLAYMGVPTPQKARIVKIHMADAQRSGMAGHSLTGCLLFN